MSPVYSNPVVAFITVSAEYCTLVEEASSLKKEELLMRLSLLLPLLYIKASMLPNFELACEEEISVFVDEKQYYSLQQELLTLLEDKDDYLVFREEDAQYTEMPQAASISEDLSDIYQSLKNCLLAYQLGTEEVMNDALLNCKGLFQEYWGIRLLNGLKAIHCINGTIVEEPEN